MPLAVATQSAFRHLFCLIAQRDNPVLLFRGLKLAANSPCGARQSSSAPRRRRSPADSPPPFAAVDQARRELSRRDRKTSPARRALTAKAKDGNSATVMDASSKVLF